VIPAMRNLYHSFVQIRSSEIDRASAMHFLSADRGELTVQARRRGDAQNIPPTGLTILFLFDQLGQQDRKFANSRWY
jgi:hypothetical protein